jgi:iron complex outermembrane receptor protein
MNNKTIVSKAAVFGVYTFFAVSALAQTTNAPSAGVPSATPIPAQVTAPAAAPSEEMAPIIVTGSMIPTTAGEVGPTEVTFVTDQQIQNRAPNSLFDALKQIDPSLVGGGNFGQEANNTTGEVGEAHFSIRNLETLVLLDGNRMTNSPNSDGGAVDVNLIPLSFIDHVEILKDGASSIYGSDAVGGVVNVITKQNYTGGEISNDYGFAGDKGNYFTDTASIIGGSTTDTTSFFAGVEVHDNNAILSKERAVASLPATSVAALGGTPPSYYSGTIPSVVQNIPNAEGGNLTYNGSSRFIIAGSPYAAGAAASGPFGGANTSITTPGNNGPITGTDQQRLQILAEDGYISTSQVPAYGSVGNTFLNTTQFGTYSFTPQTSEKAFANFDHQFYKKSADMYGSFLYSHEDGTARLAPQPVPNVAMYDITIPANNPYNPFGVPVGTDGTDSTTLRYRSVDAGTRNYEQISNYFHFVGGIRGTFGLGNSGDSDYHYNASFAYDREESDYITFNSLNGAVFQQIVTPSATNPFINVLGTPTYNPFGIVSNNSPATTKQLDATLFNDGTAQLYETKADMGGILASIPSGDINFDMGGEYRIETLEINDDGVTSSGEAIGVNATSSFGIQKRDTYAGYLELDVPVVGPDMHIPGIYSFNVDGSARIEEIAGGANAEVARVNGIWLPFGSRELSLRANFSNSFIAPTLYSEYGPALVSSNQVTLVDGPSQQFINELSSPGIPNIEAQNFGGGFTYSPKWAPGATLSADYYNVIQTGGVAYAPYQPEVDSLEAQGSASPYASAFTFANGSHLTSTAANQINAGNFGSLNEAPTPDPTTQKTAGVDVTFNYVLPWKKYGTFTVGATGTYLINYTDQNGIPNGAYVNKAGSYTDPAQSGGTGQGLLPKWQINPYFEYDWGGFTYNLDAVYVPTTIDFGDSNGVAGENDYSLSGNPYPIPEYYKIDMSMAYEWGKPGVAGLPFFQDPATPTPATDDPKDMKSGKETLASVTPTDWFDGLRVQVGVNNLNDEAPPYIPSSAEDNTAKSEYDIVGRFFYLQVSKKF